MGLVARQGAWLVLLGVLAGALGGAAATGLLRGLLYGVSRDDPRAWGLAVACMVASGAVAALVPALRAARVDPQIAMREE